MPSTPSASLGPPRSLILSNGHHDHEAESFAESRDAFMYSASILEEAFAACAMAYDKGPASS